jgi:hypothetical protein
MADLQEEWDALQRKARQLDVIGRPLERVRLMMESAHAGVSDRELLAVFTALEPATDEWDARLRAKLVAEILDGQPVGRLQ